MVEFFSCKPAKAEQILHELVCRISSLNGTAGKSEFCETENDDIEKLDQEVVDGCDANQNRIKRPIEHACCEDATHENRELRGYAPVGVAFEDKQNACEEIDGDLNHQHEGVSC